MIKTLGVVLALTVLGEAAGTALNAPVPGAAIGMLLLTALYTARGEVDANMARLFDIAAPHFPLFFIPAAVGVVASADVLEHTWLHIAFAIVFGTMSTIVVTGMTAQLLLRVVRTA